MEGGVGRVPQGTRSQGPWQTCLTSPIGPVLVSVMQRPHSSRFPVPPSSPGKPAGQALACPTAPSTTWGGTTSIHGVCTFKSGD